MGNRGTNRDMTNTDPTQQTHIDDHNEHEQSTETKRHSRRGSTGKEEEKFTTPARRAACKPEHGRRGTFLFFFSVTVVHAVTHRKRRWSAGKLARGSLAPQAVGLVGDGGLGSRQGARLDHDVGGVLRLGALLVGDDLGAVAVLVGRVGDGTCAAVGQREGVAALNSSVAIAALFVRVRALGVLVGVVEGVRDRRVVLHRREAPLCGLRSEEEV